MSEKPRNAWVEYGEDNNFYQYLIDLFHSSPTNNASIQGISDLIYGEGMEAAEGSSLEAYVNFIKIFQAEDVRRVCHDLKLFGHASFQLTLDKGQVVGAFHIPRNYLRPAKVNDEGEVDTFYFSNDWSKAKSPKFAPQAFPAFGHQAAGDDVAILSVESYSPGSVYFCPVDYQGGLQYAELEGEIANYHLNNIKNGLAPSMMINFNNGVPPVEEQFEIERDILAKWGGSSNSGKAIIAFNDSPDNAATIDAVQLSDAHNQYQFLSDECIRKVMVAHRITSPMLLGIKDNTGLGNNAEELQVAYELFKNSVIKPFRHLVAEAAESVMAHNGQEIELYFKDLSPVMMEASATPAKLNKVEMSIEAPHFSETAEEAWLKYLEDKGDKVDLDEWELVHEEEVTDPDEADGEVFKFFKRFSDPEEKSRHDGGVYKIRYRYDPKKTKDNSRTFCKNMVANAGQGVYYRREDIEKMSSAGVNSEFAPKGSSSYSIWRFKGGVNCHHRWFRMIFKRKQIGGKVKPLDESEKGTTRRDIDDNYKRTSEGAAKSAGVQNMNPAGYDDAKMRPIDMPNKGRR
ncbi:MAG: hypothetical protein CMJ25_16135 [Phycisphaerae bacterium]|nr:hypothetical protein [Phycisphaerae bacterium]